MVDELEALKPKPNVPLKYGRKIWCMLHGLCHINRNTSMRPGTRVQVRDYGGNYLWLPVDDFVS